MEPSNLKPLAIDPANVTAYLGSGIEIKIPDYPEQGSSSRLHLPQMEPDVITFNGGPTQPIERVLGRLDS